jgi:hypothetical protein
MAALPFGFHLDVIALAIGFSAAIEILFGFAGSKGRQTEADAGPELRVAWS